MFSKKSLGYFKGLGTLGAILIFHLLVRGQDNSAFNEAYNKKDYPRCIQLLQDSLSKIQQSSDSLQLTLRSNEGEINYNLACVYALQQQSDLAIICLRKYFEFARVDYQHLQEDSDIISLRNLPQYAALTHEYRKTADYKYILDHGERYNKESDIAFPTFQYENNHPALVSLRTSFKLDSIASSTSQIVNIITLLNWVHKQIPHNGNCENPKTKNASFLLSTCKSQARGLNCRGLALVLNECYLAMGYKARIVTCYPKDSLKRDEDCHVINMVFADSLNKWLWVDPTNNAYLTDETGKLLGISEVRYKAIHNLPLRLNPDANWNGEPITLDNYIYRYMVKNLYMFESPLQSEYNMETVVEGKTFNYIKLVPSEYYLKTPKIETQISPQTHARWVTYKTTDDQLFWAFPK